MKSPKSRFLIAESGVYAWYCLVPFGTKDYNEGYFAP